ncbi:MAG: sulfotransferase [Deltaproteobacteria bacterium]|nr:sulfotransferase [Deltaproteobacteria bacterium]
MSSHALPPPFRPLPIRALNLAGRALAAFGVRRPSLDETPLLAAAERATGLADFGGDSFRPGLRELLRCFESEARLSTLGRGMARAHVIGALSTRLRLVDWRKRNPEVAAQKIARPLLVLGMPRTGTTLLHGLLAQDPAARAPLSWEVAAPCPAPETATYETDPRIAEARAHERDIEQIAPGFLAIHPSGAQLPQECVSLMAPEFMSMQWEATYAVPSYQRWCEAQNWAAAYRWHRAFLQHLQSRHAGQRWVLKTPAHLLTLDALFAEYPDALVVQTHRAPAQVVASLASLEWTLRGASSDDLDARAEGAEAADLIERMLRAGMQSRAAHPEREPQFFDLAYPDLVADPFGSVKRLYERFGLDFTSELESRMRAFLAANAADKHGVHKYTPASFGLSAAELDARYAFYTRHHDVRGSERG